MAAFSNSKAICVFVFSSIFLIPPKSLTKYKTAVFNPEKEKSKFLLWSIGRGREKGKQYFLGVSQADGPRGSAPRVRGDSDPEKISFSFSLIFSANFEICGPPG